MVEIDHIYNEDCLVGMKRIPDGSIDAVICDLPYGTTRNPWDCVIPLEPLWAQYKRVCKPSAPIVLFSQQPFTSALVMSNPTMFRYEWIWEKEMGTGFLNAHVAPLKNHENIMVFYSKKPTYNPIIRKGKPYRCKQGGASTNYDKPCNGILTVNNGDRFPLSIIKFDRDSEKIHPTQKPVSLIRYLIATYTNEGGVILDNCSGSGTTAVAAIREKRHFIGFELNKEYYDASIRRIKAEQMQKTLF